MGLHDVVGHEQGVAGAMGQAGGVFAAAHAHADEALGLVKGHVMGDAVGEGFHHQAGIVAEPIHALFVHPAALMEQGGGKIPVVQSDVGRDAVGQQAVKEPVVKVDPPLVDGALSVGQEAGPGDGHAVGRNAQALEDGHILLITVVLVAGHLAGVAGIHLARPLGKIVPNAAAAAVLEGGSLDLIRGGSHAPHKALLHMRSPFFLDGVPGERPRSLAPPARDRYSLSSFYQKNTKRKSKTSGGGRGVFALRRRKRKGRVKISETGN